MVSRRLENMMDIDLRPAQCMMSFRDTFPEWRGYLEFEEYADEGYKAKVESVLTAEECDRLAFLLRVLNHREETKHVGE